MNEMDANNRTDRRQASAVAAGWVLAGASLVTAPDTAWAVEGTQALQDHLASTLDTALKGGEVWAPFAIAWLGGLLTAFTPCVYPLIPITLRYFGGMQLDGGRTRVVSRALMYVLGMVVLYATLGTVFASSNRVFGSFLSSRWVLLALSIFCAAMGLSMLGLFTVQLPTALSTRLSQVGGQSRGGAFAMGLVSGLIAAPCTGPVLAVILTLVAATGAVFLGFWLMVGFALGLGMPFLALAVFSGNLQRLPSGGRWMEIIKVMLATAMFVVAAYFLQIAWGRLAGWLHGMPAPTAVGAALVATGVLATCALVWGRGTKQATLKTAKSSGVALLTAGICALVFGGGADGQEQTAAAGGPPPIQWMTEHDEAVATAKAKKRPVMIDFTAQWCQACKELEESTYVHESVRAASLRFVSVKIDATEESDEIDSLFEHYGVLGLPTVLFIDSSGSVLDQPRVTGFVGPDRFAKLLKQIR
jgi:thiol:disulfide interchange protein DsbD